MTMTNCVTEAAYGKINLYLDVLGKRADGYHDVINVMQTVSLCDTVSVERAEACSMTCTDPTLSCGEDNLCLKAARAFFARYGTGGCRIALTKTLPREAGLGGGSADAGAVLRALNRLYGQPFSLDELCEMGTVLGADVPFCVAGRGAALAEGIGDRLSPYPSLPPCRILVTSGVGTMSTPVAYRAIDETPPSSQGNLPALTRAMTRGDLPAIGQALYNRFEDVVPADWPVIEALVDCGAVGARMTGSGTAVYGLFTEDAAWQRAEEALRFMGLKVFSAHPLS